MGKLTKKELEAEVERLRARLTRMTTVARDRDTDRVLAEGLHSGLWLRAMAAEAKVAKVEALVERWAKTEPVVGMPYYEMAYRDAEGELRAALADEDTEQQRGISSESLAAYDARIRMAQVNLVLRVLDGEIAHSQKPDVVEFARMLRHDLGGPFDVEPPAEQRAEGGA